MKSDFLVVHKSIVPENFVAVIETRKLIEFKKVNISEACKMMGISRGTYYKYKDYVFPFYEASQNKLITLTFFLENKKGVLSSILNMISDASGNVLTINQGIPLQGVANTTISIETEKISVDLETLLDKLRALNGVKRLEILGQE